MTNAPSEDFTRSITALRHRQTLTKADSSPTSTMFPRPALAERQDRQCSAGLPDEDLSRSQPRIHRRHARRSPGTSAAGKNPDQT